MLREIGEKRYQTKSIIEVFQRILESRVSLLDHVTQGVPWSHLLVLLCSFEIFLSQILFISFEMSFDVSEFSEQMVVFQNFKVLDVEISLFGALELLLWFSWVDSLENAESSEVLEWQLQFSDGVASS